MAKREIYWRGSEWPIEDIRRIKATEAYSRRVRAKRRGVHSVAVLVGLPKWPVWDRRWSKAYRAHRRWLRAKEREEEHRHWEEEMRRQINSGAKILRVQAPKPTNPEAEALAWATGYFQDKKDELTREGSKNHPIKEYARYLAREYDNSRRDPENSFSRDWFTDPTFEDPSELVEFCAFMIERGEPLPEKLRRQFAEFLRVNRDNIARQEERRTKQRGKRGPTPGDYERRDTVMKIAMRCIVERWKFEATRAVNTRKEKPKASAASVVCKALGAVGIHLEEKSVNDICDSDTFVRYFPIMEGDSSFRNMESPKARRKFRAVNGPHASVRKVNTKPKG
jgi:hypothetical protein